LLAGFRSERRRKAAWAGHRLVQLRHGKRPAVFAGPSYPIGILVMALIA
jgi:hypothetical protein